MHADRTPPRRSAGIYRAAISLAAAIICGGQAKAQSVATYLPPEVLQHGTPPRDSLFRWGMFDVSPHVAISAIYDDNINLRGGRPEDDYIFVVSPGFDIIKSHTSPNGDAQDSVLGTRLTYNPAFVFFAKNSTNNSIDHFLHWTGDMRLTRLTVSLSQDFEQSAGGVADVGTRVSQTYYLTTARISYEWSEKTSFDLSGSYTIRDYERLIGTTEWSEDNAVNYQITPKVRLGFGVTVGQRDVGEQPKHFAGIGAGPGTTSGTSETFVTPSLRAGYKTSEKTDVTASVGGEWRSYQDGSSSFGPVFSLAGTYTPWEHTSISLEAHRREQSSAVMAGQDYVATGFSAGVSRRFRERYRAHAQFSYENSDYHAAKRGTEGTRQDDYFLLRCGVDAILANSWTLGVFYQYRVNESSSGFNFDNQQIGLQTVWSY